MHDKIQESYHDSQDIYDDVLTQDKWWSELYIDLFWDGVDDNQIARKILGWIPDNFNGRLLDVPVGTAVFTCHKYARMKKARITCLDYSLDMLRQADRRLSELSQVRTMQGDVGDLPFADGDFDVVLSMNGFHVFPDKARAFSEINRVLKRNGVFIACFYVQGESAVTDLLVSQILAKKGWFTPPFLTVETLREQLMKHYEIKRFCTEGTMAYFCAVKK